MRLIDADALMEKLVSLQKKFNSNKGMDIDVFACVATINAMPTVDAMPVKSAVQLKWERDEAIQKLEEHGIPFCGKADVVDVVRCKDCKEWDEEKHWCSIRDSYGWDYKPNDYCSYGVRKAGRRCD